MLLWASKFATAKIESSFEIGKYTTLGVTFILLAMVQYIDEKVVFYASHLLKFLHKHLFAMMQPNFMQYK